MIQSVDDMHSRSSSLWAQQDILFIYTLSKFLFIKYTINMCHLLLVIYNQSLFDIWVFYLEIVLDWHQ